MSNPSQTAGRVFAVLVGILVAASGSFYTSVGSDQLLYDEGRRAEFTIAIFAVFLLRIVQVGSIALPRTVLLLFLPIGYMSAVNVAMGHGSEGFGAVVRWLLYFAVATYFSSSEGRHVIDRFVVASGVTQLALLVVGVLGGHVLSMNSANRYGGAVGSPIGLATTLFSCAVAATYFYLSRRQLPYLILATLLIAAIFVTGTRSLAIAGLLALWILWLLAMPGVTLRVFWFLATVVVSPLVWSEIIGRTDVGARIKLLASPTSDSSWQNRETILRTVSAAFHNAQRLTGVGLGRFPDWFAGVTGVTDMAPHFEVIWIYVEGGLIGTCLLAIALVSATISIGRRMRRGRLLWSDGTCAIVLIWLQMTVFQLANPTFFYQGMVVVYGLLAAILSYGAPVGSNRSRRRPTTGSLRAPGAMEMSRG